MANPIAATAIGVGAATGIAAGAGWMSENKRKEDIAKKQNTPKEDNSIWGSIGNAFNPGQLGMGGVSALNKGGSVFSGMVDNNTGTRVSGAGPDTQFLPIEGGGGAVLQKGESVLQVGARERMIKEAGIDPLAYNVGSNANKPRTVAANVLANSYGGLVGFSKGGTIGGVNDPNFWLTAALAGKEAGYIPQGQADVAQSIYNRQKMGIYPGGNDIRKIVTASGQYQPTFTNPGAWNAIKDKNTAIKAVGDPKLVDMAANSISNPSLQRNAASFIGSRSDFMGESQKKNMSPEKGDITRGKKHNFFGWFTDNGYNSRMSTAASSPFTKKTSLTSNQKSTEPTIMDRISGIMSSITRGAYAKPQKKEGGGRVIGESDGMNILGGTADRQLLPLVGGGTVAVQPGEGIVPRDVMQNFGEDNFNRFIAMFDSGRNSNAAKLGYTKPKINVPQPPIRANRGGMAPITLPPISQSSSDMASGGGIKSPSVPQFSAVSSSSHDVRKNHVDIYGIVG